MASTLTNIGLKIWNLATDAFSHSELSTNFTLLDNHDHTSGKGVQIPTGGIAGGAVTNAKLASNAVDATKVSNGALADVKLASPNNAVYKDVYSRSVKVGAGVTAGTYLFGEGGVLVPAGVDTAAVVPVFYLPATDFLVGGGLTTRLNIRATSVVNGTAPVATFVVGLYPFTNTTGAASGAIRWNVGTVAGNQATLTTPGSGPNTNTGTDFAHPSDGYYALGLTVSATTAANSISVITGRLGVRHT